MPCVCKREDAGVCAHKLSRRMSWVLGLGGGSQQFLSPYATRLNKARHPFSIPRKVEQGRRLQEAQSWDEKTSASPTCALGVGKDAEGIECPASRPDGPTDAAPRFGEGGGVCPGSELPPSPNPQRCSGGSARAPGPEKPGPRTCRESSRNAAWKSCLPGAGRRLRLPRPGPLGAGAGTLLSSRAAPDRILPGPAAGPRRGPLCTPGPRPRAPRAGACAARRRARSSGSARGRGSARAGACPRRER